MFDQKRHPNRKTNKGLLGTCAYGTKSTHQGGDSSVWLTNSNKAKESKSFSPDILVHILELPLTLRMNSICIREPLREPGRAQVGAGTRAGDAHIAGA